VRPSVCLSVFQHNISKTVAARSTKLDVEMFHHEYRKPVYLGVLRSKVKVTRHKDIAGVGHIAVVTAVVTASGCHYSLCDGCVLQWQRCGQTNNSRSEWLNAGLIWWLERSRLTLSSTS